MQRRAYSRPREVDQHRDATLQRFASHGARLPTAVDSLNTIAILYSGHAAVTGTADGEIQQQSLE
jgi:hypothetical protein